MTPPRGLTSRRPTTKVPLTPWPPWSGLRPTCGACRVAVGQNRSCSGGYER